jgi:uncharacterized protein
MLSTSNELWYANGLQFECTQCGNCCTGSPGAVWVDSSDLERIAAFREVDVGTVFVDDTKLVGGRRSLKDYANGDCVYFDGASRRCQIYPVRPAQCRTWPFWSQNLESSASWEGIKQVCPGAGRGKLYNLEQIEESREKLDA